MDFILIHSAIIFVDSHSSLYIRNEGSSWYEWEDFSPDYYLSPDNAMTSFFVHAEVIFYLKNLVFHICQVS